MFGNPNAGSLDPVSLGKRSRFLVYSKQVPFRPIRMTRSYILYLEPCNEALQHIWSLGNRPDGLGVRSRSSSWANHVFLCFQHSLTNGNLSDPGTISWATVDGGSNTVESGNNSQGVFGQVPSGSVYNISDLKVDDSGPGKTLVVDGGFTLSSQDYGGV